jgi:hypothetical protein
VLAWPAADCQMSSACARITALVPAWHECWQQNGRFDQPDATNQNVLRIVGVDQVPGITPGSYGAPARRTGGEAGTVLCMDIAGPTAAGRRQGSLWISTRRCSHSSISAAHSQTFRLPRADSPPPFRNLQHRHRRVTTRAHHDHQRSGPTGAAAILQRPPQPTTHHPSRQTPPRYGRAGASIQALACGRDSHIYSESVYEHVGTPTS